MNSFKSAIAGIAIFGTALSAFAEPSTDATIIRITGSTAFRSASHSAIVALFDSPPVAGYSGSNLSGSNQSFFYGQVGAQPVIVSTSWSGSTGGIQVVAGSIPVNFLNDNLADSGQPALALAGAGATGGTSLAVGTNSQVADVAMGDSYQSATPFKTPVLADQKVGVIGFKWIVNRGTNVVTTTATSTAGSPVLTVASSAGLSVGMTVKSTSLPNTLLKILSVDSGTQVTLTSGTGVLVGTDVSTGFASPSPISNINTQVAQALWSNGTAKLSQFTGNSADDGVTVYATGRDPDSGTRLTTFAESGIGVDSTVTQYKPTVSGSTITAVAPYPPQTVNGILFTEGNGGESSGSTLRNYFGLTSAAINGYIISYMSTGDAPTAINAGGKELTYNGVAFSDAALREGLYTFWCYQHVLYSATWNSAAGGSLEAKKKAIVDVYANLIKTTYAPIKLNEMNCSRTADGGVVFHN
ncbi:MAG: hypothetical protein U0984_01390 [Prosthecobacter sp.]|nr:hypothetical protein [Prosthecobacter sp.]